MKALKQHLSQMELHLLLGRHNQKKRCDLVCSSLLGVFAAKKVILRMLFNLKHRRWTVWEGSNVNF